MPDWLIELLAQHPSYTYVGIGSIFVLCGVGLPLPEELVLVYAGFLCYQVPQHAVYGWMATACAAGILLGDVLPFLAGSVFGPRLLRVRWVRLIVSRERLATFDRWFRRRGDMVILIARFIPGLRVVAFFTGGTMRMRWSRFLLLDLMGIALVAPLLVFVGWHFGKDIEKAYQAIQKVENSILWAAGILVVLLGMWYWLRRRAHRRRLVSGPSEAFVGSPSGAKEDARSDGETPVESPAEAPSVEPRPEAGDDRVG